MRSDRGFTLIELLVVFAIIALLMALTPVAFQKLKESSDYRAAVSAMINDMRLARQQALVYGYESQFVVDVNQRSFGLARGKLHDLPSPLSVRATVAEDGNNDAGVFAIRFLPAGGATGGSIELTRSAGNGVKLTVDWLTGTISQEAIDP